MGKNKGKGGKSRRRGARSNRDVDNRELVFKDGEHEYGIITKACGESRFVVFGADGLTRTGKVCGKFHKKVWVSVGDLVLLSLRDFQDGKCDIVHKYHSEEVRKLRVLEELTGLDVSPNGVIRCASTTTAEQDLEDVGFLFDEI